MRFYEEGVQFECQRCGGCCNCEGYVFIFQNDYNRLIASGRFTEESLRMDYLSTFQGYTVLRSRPDHTCILWDKEINGCMAYDCRPIQCQTYPFWNTVFKDEDRFKAEQQDCPGIGKGKHFSADEIDELRKKV